MNERQGVARWELFSHGSDIGIRGIGPGPAQAFEQAGVALTAAITAPDKVEARSAVEIRCSGADRELLLFDWINALIFEMATRSMLFRRFEVALGDAALAATAWGEAVDVERHRPAVEAKGATFTELAVTRDGDGNWVAQCVVDV